MATIEEIIQREANPFDPVTFKTGNFWQEENTTAISIVDSIHQEVVQEITSMLRQVSIDHRTRSILLTGDSGSGKSYLLKRLKQTLNSTAFFAYIPPFSDKNYVWRHTLRYTVDSLMHQPEGQSESQLLLWLKNLSVFKKPGFWQKLLGEQAAFINHFKKTYPTDIYQSKSFFNILYALTQSDLYFSACNWLRGEDLDEADLKALNLKKSIDSEADAQGFLSNFGRISTSTYPIVLCFDQIECFLAADGSADIQPAFTINTVFHNESFKNFLVIISVTMNAWKQNNHRIQQSDRARIEKGINLKSITLEQAEALWESRLQPLHRLAQPQPESKIYPLNRNILQQKFPGGKTNPRAALMVGKDVFLAHKFLGRSIAPLSQETATPSVSDPITTATSPIAPSAEPVPVVEAVSSGVASPPNSVPVSPIPVDEEASFKLLWEQELRKTEQKVTRIGQFSAPELIAMLSKVLSALQITGIQPKLLPSPTYASYSCSYQDGKQPDKQGVIWAENQNMTSFFHIMEACRKLQEQTSRQKLYLIRAETTGRSNTKGHTLYQQIFLDSPTNQHLKPDLESVHYLATYDRLVNSVHSQELVVAGQVVPLQKLEELVRNCQVFQKCQLLQELGILPVTPVALNSDLQREKEFLLNFVKTQQLVSRKVTSQHTCSQFPRLQEAQVQRMIEELCQEKAISILDSSAKLDEQILCLIPEYQVAS